MSEPKPENIKSKELDSRLKTALIILPILFCFLYFKTLYYILMLAIIKLGYSEYEFFINRILGNIFKEYYSEINYKTLLSSSLSWIIFMLCPSILYFFNNSILFASLIPIFIQQLHRLSNFISIFRVLKMNQTNFKYMFNTPTENKDPFSVVEKITNPLKTASSNLSHSIKNKEINKSENVRETFLKLLPQKLKTEENDTPRTIEKLNENKMDNSSLLMFISCFVIIMSDLLFFFVYIFPLCFGILLHNSEHGFIYLLTVVVIAYQCDNGALLFGRILGKHNFGSPVTPSKTIEGVYGAIFSG